MDLDLFFSSKTSVLGWDFIYSKLSWYLQPASSHRLNSEYYLCLVSSSHNPPWGWPFTWILNFISSCISWRLCSACLMRDSPSTNRDPGTYLLTQADWSSPLKLQWTSLWPVMKWNVIIPLPPFTTPQPAFNYSLTPIKLHFPSPFVLQFFNIYLTPQALCFFLASLASLTSLMVTNPNIFYSP